jgi:hypothetical protein
VVGDHLLAERLDLGIAALRFGKLAGVDVDLVGGDDDGSDLRIAGRLGLSVGAEQEEGCDRSGLSVSSWTYSVVCTCTG